MKTILATIAALLLCLPVKAQLEGLVRIAAACMRSNPGHSNELVSQAVMGTPLKLIEKQDGWWLTETPDGYQGYIISNSIQAIDSASMDRWRKAERVMYTGVYTTRIVSPDGRGIPVSDIHPGSVLEVTGHNVADSLDVKLPDGRRGRMASARLKPLETMGLDEPDTDEIIDMARALMGVSYLWGGTTTAAMDCSGLVKVCYLNQGLILERDAGPQAASGTPLGPDWHNYQRGDLIFFVSETTGNIVHVAIYDHDGIYVHSSGRVRVSSLDPDSPIASTQGFTGIACRIAGNTGTPGITAVAHSPAYFPRDKACESTE